ncbi:helix-turn-helix DNA-binding protein [Gordonia phage Lozinak]|uniref:Helix-turn-helix DNA-binding protein n=4 Tax=Smoothievirus TaxID=1982557 RepID=A0A2D1GG96_9CAUD|nr:helix-turn-helix DNA binding protein [Gordonia phage Smoothie]YP_009276211.1 helix-turn-helix DNA binding protein [Gordonia phage Bachita]YP_009281253.1 helix-turn-helix DNA binding protein [Gordonia phage Cucurbita]ATN90724.1 helix-turn-helix DNA-binding protein [Gordonia phage Lozinak]QAU06964.1 helix-turn-helix DNA-binding protein [Gordonia phage Aphelion]QKY79675.1 helix-turn-helix DNA-binding domain protein [Gordonia Phage Engineer]QYC53584.1 helix-turn-helix DNA-binding domain protei
MTGPSLPKLSYGKRELADAVGVSEATIDREIKAGRIEVRYIRNKVVIMHEEAVRYLNDAPTEREDV